VPVSSVPPAPPALLKRERTEGRKRKKFYIYLDITHTHPAGAGSTLKCKRKRKADTHTHDGQKAKTAHGGRRERTDLQHQPTRRNGPDKKQSTHLNPTTHYGEAPGKIREQMGD